MGIGTNATDHIVDIRMWQLTVMVHMTQIFEI